MAFLAWMVHVVCRFSWPMAKLTWLITYKRATSWECLLMLYANNKDADQPAHPCCLISAFVVHCLDSIIIHTLAKSKISRPKLVSVAEQVGLSRTWSQTPKTGFLVMWLKYSTAVPMFQKLLLQFWNYWAFEYYNFTRKLHCFDGTNIYSGCFQAVFRCFGNSLQYFSKVRSVFVLSAPCFVCQITCDTHGDAHFTHGLGMLSLDNWSKLIVHIVGHIWAALWQNQQCGCAPSEDSDQPGHPPSLITVFAVCSMGSSGSKLSSCGQQRLWSDWADAQADLSLRWAHSHFVGFVTRWLIL